MRSLILWLLGISIGQAGCGGGKLDLTGSGTGGTDAMGSGVSAIRAGASFSCAMIAGAVKCWGDNAYGELGDGTTTESWTPVQVQGLTIGVTAISVGESHACAIVNGAAYCWGFRCDASGCGDDTAVPFQVVGLTSGVTVISLAYQTCAVVSGSAQCWGDDTGGSPVQVVGLTSNVTDIAAGGQHVCAIVNGGAQCWGNNSNCYPLIASSPSSPVYCSYGNLGNGTTTDSDTPVQVERCRRVLHFPAGKFRQGLGQEPRVVGRKPKAGFLIASGWLPK